MARRAHRAVVMQQRDHAVRGAEVDPDGLYHPAAPPKGAVSSAIRGEMQGGMNVGRVSA
jgi:hypothetical protein